ncbi:MAG: hypothetical protein ABI972_31310 [Acidobacteriota bacterium]
MKRSLVLGAICVFILSSCAKDIQNKDAVRQGVVEHLKARKNLDLDLTSMQLEVTAVTFRENEADATVSFVPKGASASQGMSMKYTLVREGSVWKVKQKAESTNNPHSGGMSAPPMSPPEGSALPPGHPPMPPTGGARK